MCRKQSPSFAPIQQDRSKMNSLSRSMKLQIQYGSDIHELFLTGDDQQIRVEHILDQIEKLTKVPKCHQNILYKGQRIDQKPQVNLDDLYIFNNSKLILTGTQRQFHDRSCCSDHDHPISSTILPKKQETCPTVHGFIPEPNKTYE